MKQREVINLWSAVAEYEALNNCIELLGEFPRLKHFCEPMKEQMTKIRLEVEDFYNNNDDSDDDF